VLISDDDRDIRDMLHMLEHDEGGYAVIDAGDVLGGALASVSLALHGLARCAASLAVVHWPASAH
jgi:hypothetical protein